MLLEHITAGSLIAHGIGDYVIQSDWMANEKTKRWAAAWAHALSYTLVFLLLTTSWKALLFIGLTHLAIDHWRLARYVCWLKNFLSPSSTSHNGLVEKGPGHFVPGVITTQWWHPWKDCVGTGYHKDKPLWLTMWLLFIADNIMHVLCNTIALTYLN